MNSKHIMPNVSGDQMNAGMGAMLSGPQSGLLGLLPLLLSLMQNNQGGGNDQRKRDDRRERLERGQRVRGPGDGRSDDVPAYADGGAFSAKVRLSDGEYVVPADVVSAMGRGSTDAGAKQLDKMVERNRKQWRKQMGAFDGPRKGK